MKMGTLVQSQKFQILKLAVLRSRPSQLLRRGNRLLLITVKVGRGIRVHFR